METAVGWIALTMMVSYTCIGLPAQIYKNYKSKSTRGLSLFTNTLSFLTFLAWIVYGLTRKSNDFYITTANFPGAVFSLIILGQFAIYRKKRAS